MMGIKDNWKGIVKSVAPILGTALGGPMGGAAVRVIAEGLLGNADATEQDVAEYVASASPDALIRLRELDADFQHKMKALDIDVYRLEVDDRKSARELAQYNMKPHMLLSVIFIGGYLVILYNLLSGNFMIDESVKTESSLIIGVLTASVTMIMQFWFGSSLGSKEKATALKP